MRGFVASCYNEYELLILDIMAFVNNYETISIYVLTTLFNQIKIKKLLNLLCFREEELY